MKKFWRIVLVVLALVGIFGLTCNVASAETSSVSDSSENTDVETEFSFQKIEQMTDEEAIKTYCKVVYDRTSWTNIEGHFLTSDEYKYLIANDFNIDNYDNRFIKKYDKRYGGSLSRYSFPVIFEGENGIELWYTTMDGTLRAEAIEGELNNGYSWDIIGDVHHTLGRYEVSLKKCLYYDIAYDSTTGCISVWEFGVKIREHYVPKNSIYAGFSGNEGFIFRNGSDVYAVRDYGCGTKVYEVRLIAHDVEFVIAADYEADGSGEFSQPLFLMKDGTVKCYCTFYSDEGTPADDASNLIDIRFEGGFNI